MRIKKKYFLDILIYLVIAILVFALLCNISSKSDKVYDIVKLRNYVIVTGSMKPTINPGDLVLVKKADVDTIKKGDIISFSKDGMTATHRVVAIEKDTVTTQGDSNNIHDNPIEKKYIIGKYLFKIPKAGYVFAFTSSIPGIILIVTLLICYFVYDFMIGSDSKSKGKHDIDSNSNNKGNSNKKSEEPDK